MTTASRSRLEPPANELVEVYMTDNNSNIAGEEEGGFSGDCVS
jgi:hypothetical protein